MLFSRGTYVVRHRCVSRIHFTSKFPNSQIIAKPKTEELHNELIVALFLITNTFFAFSSRGALINMTPKPSITETKGEFGASHTSFYTSSEKKESYESLDDVLNNKCRDPQVREVIKDMFAVCADITIALRTALVTVEGSTNDFGDTQLSVDVSGSIRLTRYIVGVFVSRFVQANRLFSFRICNRLSPTN